MTALRMVRDRCAAIFPGRVPMLPAASPTLRFTPVPATNRAVETTRRKGVLRVEHCLFIHTNQKQYLGALIAQYAARRNSTHNDRFDVRIIHHKDYPFLHDREGQPYLREGLTRPWLNDDLQSFTPLRFMPPELMNYQGRAVIVDPDVFAVGDVWELLSRDMGGKAILCRARSGTKAREGCLDTLARRGAVFRAIRDETGL